jgi:prepilin-type N-terminal cleavage/methylation domain-containing protein
MTRINAISSPRLSQAGFTLLETLVALGILSIAMSMTVSCLFFNLRSNTTMKIRYEAIQAAQNVLDDIRFLDPSTLTGTRQEDIVISNRSYRVNVSYCRNPALCISTDSRHVTVEVSYKSQLVYETDTVFSKFI